MDEERFDQLVRSVGGRGASRRSVLSGLAGGGVATLGLGVDGAEADRCPRPKRCPGGKCCTKTGCFARTVDVQTTKPTSYGCCPVSLFCKAKSGKASEDECCYKDEQCIGRRKGSSSGICCRSCPDRLHGGCCPSESYCVNGTCEILDTARLPRRRR